MYIGVNKWHQFQASLLQKQPIEDELQSIIEMQPNNEQYADLGKGLPSRSPKPEKEGDLDESFEENMKNEHWDLFVAYYNAAFPNNLRIMNNNQSTLPFRTIVGNTTRLGNARGQFCADLRSEPHLRQFLERTIAITDSGIREEIVNVAYRAWETYRTANLNTVTVSQMHNIFVQPIRNTVAALQQQNQVPRISAALQTNDRLRDFLSRLVLQVMVMCYEAEIKFYHKTLSLLV